MEEAWTLTGEVVLMNLAIKGPFLEETATGLSAGRKEGETVDKLRV
jgi:hypothetical protein